jgi:hypothetical protein
MRLQSCDNSARPGASPPPSYHVPDEARPLVQTSYRHTFAANIEQQWAVFVLKLLFRSEFRWQRFGHGLPTTLADLSRSCTKSVRLTREKADLLLPPEK